MRVPDVTAAVEQVQLSHLRPGFSNHFTLASSGNATELLSKKSRLPTSCESVRDKASRAVVTLQLGGPGVCVASGWGKVHPRCALSTGGQLLRQSTVQRLDSLSPNSRAQPRPADH